MYFASITIVVLVIMGIICGITQIYLEKKICKQSILDKTNIILPSSMMWGIGFLAGLIFSVISIMAFLDNAKEGELIAFCFFIWLGIILMYGWLSQIIVYDHQGFIKGWLPGLKRHYRYKDFTAMKSKGNGVVFYIGKKKITFDYLMGNAVGFTGYAIRRYTEITGKDILIDKTIPKRDVFKGHVESPEEFMFVGILLLMFSLLPSGISLFQTFDTVTETDTINMEVIIESYTIQDDTLVLKIQENDIKYEINGYESCHNILSTINEAIRLKNPMEVKVLPIMEDNENIREYDIYAMEDLDGNEYVSFDTMNQEREKDCLIGALCSLIFFVITLLLCIIMIYVGRNPHKFSKRVLGWFFKEGYIKE